MAGFGVGEGVFAVGSAVVVDVALGERGAQPADEGAAAGVACQRGFAGSGGGGGEAEELGVEAVGEVFA